MIIRRSANGGEWEELEVIVDDFGDDECHVCGRRANYKYLAEGQARPVCGKHYQFELETDLDLWADSHGTCCEWHEGCGDLVHQFVERHKALPVLCVKHMAVTMRNDDEVAIKVCAIFAQAEKDSKAVRGGETIQSS